MQTAFTKTQMVDEWLLPEGGAPGVTVVSDTITGKSRWSVRHALVFRLDDQPPDEAWLVNYSTGATEMQDEQPREGSAAVKAVLVRKRQVTRDEWVSSEA